MSIIILFQKSAGYNSQGLFVCRIQFDHLAMFQFITIVLTLATISAHGEENVENQFDFNIANTDTVSQSKQI